MRVGELMACFGLDDLIIPGFLVAGVGVIGLLFYLSIEQSRAWEEFAKEHNCVKVAHISGSIYNTASVGVNGTLTTGVVVESDKESFLCDDGVTYTR